jgi:3',5'-nucleoside bisphosphate phosphatase
MIPPLIVEEALERGIQLIAITDHNASANVAAVQQAASQTGLVVLPAMELQTREEVHVLCLFDTLDQLSAMQAWVDHHLPAIPNNPDYFGEQFIVDASGDFIAREERLLLNSVDVSLRQAWQQVDHLGGLFIPAHINRTAFGLIGVLGLVPDDLPVEALEISRHMRPEETIRKFPQIKGYPLIQNGDVHFLADYLGATTFTLEAPTVAELRLALSSLEERSFRI